MFNKIDRIGTFSSKWDEAQKDFLDKDMIHMSVADMDLSTSHSIKKAIISKTEVGILGYTYFSNEARQYIVDWMKNQHKVEVHPEWIVFVPRITIAANIFVKRLSEEGDSIIINNPTYPPLRQAIENHNRVPLNHTLQQVGDTWEMNLKQLEKKINHNVKAMILINPDNPSGRAWSFEELSQLSQFARAHNLFVFSDEVHSEILNVGSQHTSMLAFANELNNRIIYANSLSKTFNIPGLIMSYLIIPDKTIREAFEEELMKTGINNPPVFANEVIKAAYKDSGEWLEKMLKQVNSNERKLRNAINESMPKIKLLKREATYLSLLDFSNFKITEKSIIDWFENDLKITVYPGSNFGENCESLIRLNLATDSNTFDEVIRRMTHNYHKIKEYENEAL